MGTLKPAAARRTGGYVGGGGVKGLGGWDVPVKSALACFVLMSGDTGHVILMLHNVAGSCCVTLKRTVKLTGDGTLSHPPCWCPTVSQIVFNTRSEFGAVTFSNSNGLVVKLCLHVDFKAMCHFCHFVGVEN